MSNFVSGLVECAIELLAFIINIFREREEND